MIISSEALSERYLHVNNCGKQVISIEDTVTIRERGRMDYHMLYILSGACHAVIDGKEVSAPAGSLILFRPFERQEYRFYKSEGSAVIWIHFAGIGCETYLRELGLYDKTVSDIGKNAELSAALRECCCHAASRARSTVTSATDICILYCRFLRAERSTARKSSSGFRRYLRLLSI